MLRKLLKYEWKATSRILLPFYGVVLVLAVINRFLIKVGMPDLDQPLVGAVMAFVQFIAQVSTMIFVLTVVLTFALTLIVLIQRFYKNLLGDEGYLMFTLPVTVHQNITAKLLTSGFWVCVNVVVVALSLLITFVEPGFFAAISKGYQMVMAEIAPFMGVQPWMLWSVGVIAVVAMLAQSVLTVYASISLGQLFNKHKLLASFGAYAAVTTAMQMISALVLPVLYVVDPRIFMEDATAVSGAIWLAIGLSLVLSVIFAAGMYVLTHQLLSRRLNLE